ncbi:MAG: ATP-binding protein [Candidatus Promineifilaceae bacterium]
MDMALPNPSSRTDAPSSLRSVRFIRLALPLFLFALATSFEIWEHWVKARTLFLDPGGFLEVFIFGVVGPLAVFVTLTYVSHILQELEEARTRMTALNQNLEQVVSERTAALQISNTELEQANLRLREVDRLKSDFVSLVSHELRAPLATLNGGLEVARQYEDTLPIKAQRVLQLLAGETQRLTQFVQTMLDVSQLEAGKLQLTCGPVAVKPMLMRAVEVVLGLEAARVVWHLPADLPPIWADEVYVEQALRNLVRNVQKYTPPQTPINLSASVYARTLQICVTDNGPGIPLTEQDLVFERFYRTANGGERQKSGWGLGLYFARALTEAQGGTLTLQSPVYSDAAAPGTRFTLTLPIAEEGPDYGEATAN